MSVITDPGRCGNSKIEIQEKNGGKGVFAREDILMNSIINLHGVISSRPTMYSIQLEKNRHLNVPADEIEIDNPDFFWKYLNHSCEPNGYIDTANLTFGALRKINRGEECTFNYLTTEYEMAAPFACQCGSAKCFGLIQGYSRLTAEQKKELTLHSFPLMQP